uniref:ADF-H domain-containing protein n=1 Tax=Timema genevievae TaxID=629358 RepID=A0A7R9JY92_TIMGE|nr:unnamed protein product [Timema genevievae]
MLERNMSLERIGSECNIATFSSPVFSVSTSKSHNVKVCDIGDDVKEALKKFRFRKHENNAALIRHQPRYVVYSYRMAHQDGRVSFPMCFIYYTPRDSQIALQIMYAGTKLALQKEADLTHVYDVRELDELTEEWLQEKLAK